ncbi:MAG: choline dehydrogenase-like flavoprotein [Phenylobacterium sp.]|jgi:choline dehydrogenase-like flavoprotein
MSIYIEQSDEIFDAIVVGSGISGGWAAKAFTERGLKTLMIERGRAVEHQKDYVGENKAPWEFDHRTKVDNLLVQQQHKIQQQCYAFNDATKQFFGNDRDLPYSTETGTQFSWIRANQLGGKSLLWHRYSYRFSDFDFNANKLDGHGCDWPIRYKDLAPWYQQVEHHVGICGSQENLPQLPDGDFLPPFEMNAPEKALKKTIEAHFPGRHLINARSAHLTKPAKHHIEQGRTQCMARNECQRGCSFGGYFSTQSSTLPDANSTGLLKIATNAVVHSLIYDAKTNRVKGVRVIDNVKLTTREYFGKVVFLCASTLGSTQILLNSTSKHFPNGLSNSSGVLGRYLMDHNYNAGAWGYVDGYEEEYYSGRRPCGIYMPNFYYRPDSKRKFVRGYAMAGKAYREGWKHMRHSDGIGVEFKNRLRQPGRWKFGLYAQGEMLPRFDNQVSLHPTLKDKWGIPQLHINCTFSANETDMMQDAAEQGHLMLTKAGLTDVQSEVTKDPPGLAIHELGSARMGRDGKDSIVNGFNQSHDVPNLFVTDGASFCSTAVQNPSLTIMALTLRAADYAVKALKNRQL